MSGPEPRYRYGPTTLDGLDSRAHRESTRGVTVGTSLCPGHTLRPRSYGGRFVDGAPRSLCLEGAPERDGWSSPVDLRSESFGLRLCTELLMEEGLQAGLKGQYL